MNIILKEITIEDLEEYEFWKLPQHEYHQLNGPYFKKDSISEIKNQIRQLRVKFKDGIKNPLPLKKLIVNEKDQLIGEVSSYWKSKETNWMEIGIVIFNKANRGLGIGENAFRLWIDDVFKSNPTFVRLGISTWSGNMGMIKLAVKMGMIKEAEYRKARIVNGEYFDSVSYGILKTEWQIQKID